MPKRIVAVSAFIVVAILSTTTGLLQETHAASGLDVAAVEVQQQPNGSGGGPGPEPNKDGSPAADSAGEAALQGTFYWAVVRRDGTNARRRGVVSSTRLATGQYQVLFLDNVRNCAYTATIGDFDASGVETPGEITTVGRITDVRGVFVTTHNSAGTFQDRSFHLLVSC
jgi:hypothetical protein